MLQIPTNIFRNAGNIPADIKREVVTEEGRKMLVEKNVLYDKMGNEVVLNQKKIDLEDAIAKVQLEIESKQAQKVELETLLNSDQNV